MAPSKRKRKAASTASKSRAKTAAAPAIGDDDNQEETASPTVVSNVMIASDAVLKVGGRVFLHSVQLQRGTRILQTVSTGDVVAVALPHADDLTRHFSKVAADVPWKATAPSWRVGQVLALVQQTNSSNNSSNQRNATTISAVIQWLLPLPYVKKALHSKQGGGGGARRLVDPADFKSTCRTIRNHFMLWAQSGPPPPATDDDDSSSNSSNNGSDSFFQSVVDVKRVLPVAIDIRDHAQFRDRQKPVPLLADDSGCFQFGFHCHRTLPPVQQQQQQQQQGDATGNRNATKCGPDDFVPTATAAAKTVVQGWTHRLPALQRQLTEPQRKRVVRALHKRYDATQHYRPPGERFQYIGGGGGGRPGNDDDDDDDDTESVSEEEEESTRKKKPPAPKRKASKAKIRIDTKTAKTKGKPKALPPPALKKQQQKSINKKRASIEEPSSSAAQPFKKIRFANEQKVDQDDDDDAETKMTNTTCTTVSSVPRSPCYVLKGRRNKNNGSSSSSNINNNQKPNNNISFYDRVELLKTKGGPLWTIRVGDLIAVACEDAIAEDPIFTLHGKKTTRHQSKWYPFQQPWSAAQVCSIYEIGNRTGGKLDDDIMMEIRWFNRPCELPEEVLDHTRPTIRQELLGEEDGSATKKKKNAVQKRLLSGRRFVEVDESVLKVSVASALGRISITSVPDPDPSWLNCFQNVDDKIPQLPIVCSHIWRMKNYSGAEGCSRLKGAGVDWTDYASDPRTALVDGPLHRGIACPKVYPGKDDKVFRAYGGKQFVKPKPLVLKKTSTVTFSYDVMGGERREVAAVAEAENDDSSTDSSMGENMTAWPKELLLSDFDCTGEKPLCRCKQPKGPDRNYLLRVSVSVPAKRFHARATGRKSSTSGYQWKLNIGDVVAVAYNGANKIALRGNSRGTWFPFVGPWRICQVLNIYRDAGSTKPALLEVRWFLRESDLPAHVLRWMPRGDLKQPHEEVYETDLIETNVPIAHVLGGVEMYLGRHCKPSNSSHTKDDKAITVACRCRYFYHSTLHQFQPMFCSDPSPHRWMLRLMERGFQSSSTIKKNNEISGSIEMGLTNIRIFDQNFITSMGDSLFNNANAAAEGKDLITGEVMHFEKDKENKMEGITNYSFVSVLPRWSKYEPSDFFCSKIDRKGLLRWTVQVGDFVAIEADSDATSSAGTNYPFAVSWIPALVVAVYRKQSDDESSPLLLKVCWYTRPEDCGISEKKASFNGLHPVFSTSDIGETDSTKLLGPLCVFPGDSERHLLPPSDLWDTLSPYLPAAPCFHAGHFDRVRKQKVVAPLYCDLVQNALEQSGHYGGIVEQVMEFLQAKALDAKRHETAEQRPIFLINMEKSSHEPVEGEEGTKTWTSIHPFHVDRSKGIQYYSEMEVEPPSGQASVAIPVPTQTCDGVWTVKLGDTVAIQCSSCCGRATYFYGTNLNNEQIKSSNHKYAPFKMPWAVGEIVSIMRPCSVSNDSSLVSDNFDESGIKIEIRWFYREKEWPGNSKPPKRESELDCEELLESDLYDEIDAAAILAPVSVYENVRPVTFSKHYLGMPELEFHCHRYWSAQRKALVPVGGPAARMARARAHSKRVGNDASLKASLARISPSKISGDELAVLESTTGSREIWTEAFKSVIHKLSLTDASKEAYENGSVLVGREQERKQIMSFLRNSIRGKSIDNTKGSVFVAGPPGVGKTACIRAVISELQREQSAGKMPAFDFISLNGMEMRNPFEAYTKLWEELDRENGQCNHTIAAKRLETYFDGKGQCCGNDERAVVVLLDEIDYLVTKNQSVLYSFFDWPTKSMATKSNRRLIVIGVSNTLNLPERLHPRVQSRIGSKRIFFKAYNVNETVEILQAKTKQASPDYMVFDHDAILFAAKKTAALSGDLRKAFHICRSAAETILNNPKPAEPGKPWVPPIVKIRDVLKVTRESFNSAQSKMVANCTPYEALLMIALASLSRTSGREFGGFDLEELMTKMEAFANASGNPLYLPALTLPQALGILGRLGDAGLISLETPRHTSMSYRASLAGSGGAWPLVSMAMDDVAVLLALKRTPHNDLAQKHLSRRLA